MSYAAMLGEVERVYRVDARGLEGMRIDLCAGVESVPVPWFHQHLRVKWKRRG